VSSPASSGSQRAGTVRQQPRKRFPWVLYPACNVLDDDFFSSI
jgi:hypothetical protein